jgi:hypothetical protein
VAFDQSVAAAGVEAEVAAGACVAADAVVGAAAGACVEVAGVPHAAKTKLIALKTNNNERTYFDISILSL